MSTKLTIVQLNVERSKHLSLIVPFINAEQPDVFCAQEFMERDVAQLEKDLSMKAVFAPMSIHPADGNPGVMGVAIFSRYPITVRGVEFAHGVTEPLPQHVPGIPDIPPNPVLVCDIEKEGVVYRIATVHFTWAAGGGTNEAQRTNAQALIKEMSKYENFILTGDFNAPRGDEIFSLFASAYKDNVPLMYTSSIDGAHHKAGELPYMVDGVFSTSGYEVSNVKMHRGVSDHCALTAEITQLENKPVLL